MSEHNSPLATALAYHEAWTNKDFERAMTYIADDVICDAPAGRIEGAAAFRGFMGPFVQLVVGAEVLAAFGDDETALVMYDTETIPVKSAPAADWVKVKDGRITYSRLLFDRAPFDAAHQAAAQRPGE